MPESHTNALCDTRTKMEHTPRKQRNIAKWIPGMVLGIALLYVPVSGWAVESTPQAAGNGRETGVNNILHCTKSVPVSPNEPMVQCTKPVSVESDEALNDKESVFVKGLIFIALIGAICALARRIW